MVSVLTDLSTGLKTSVTYQRKSGDASTFLGNTMFLMGVLAYTYDMDNVECALFAGDDSLLIGTGVLDRVDDVFKAFQYDNSFFLLEGEMLFKC